MPFYQAGLAQGGFDRGIQQALERLLISPQFLYRIERVPTDAPAGAAFAVSDLELASRLSFFLWSSIPDQELLTLADGGRLREPGVIEAQVRRMLADPRAESLVTNFATQWLFVPDIEVKDPDLYLFRNYDETLRDAFAREIELFVGSVFAGNSSVLDLLTANHTFINERLAEHYGIRNIVGSHFRRVSLPADSPRAGLLGKGGILTLTSYSTRTSPVLRGKYVLDNLLASPPPAPPPDVPSLATEDEADGAALTMREALARHREDPACAGCHYDMDAIGFALENFDATGRWRDWDWVAGAAIDPASELPDGTPIDGVAGSARLSGPKPRALRSGVHGETVNVCDRTQCPVLRCAGGARHRSRRARRRLRVCIGSHGHRPERAVSDAQRPPRRDAVRFITQKAIPRRTFLRGIGASLALPALDAMVPAFGNAPAAISTTRFRLCRQRRHS